MKLRNEPVYAAIDVGTNAVRLKLARRRPDGTLGTIHQQRDAVRPGEGLYRTGAMSEAVADRLIAVLREYAERCDFYQAEVRAVATSAVREASNGAEVVRRVREEAGVALEVISGREEARLVCLGVLDGAAPEVQSLCIDIGGGSTEVALALGAMPTGLWSLQLGTVRMTEQVDGDGRHPAEELARMRAFARDVARSLPARPEPTHTEALGCSGSVRALIGFATAETRPCATVAELSRAVDELVALGPIGRRRFFEARRADIIVAAAVILEAVATQLGVETVRAVKRGLRDGVLLDLVRGSQRREFTNLSQSVAAR